MPLRVSALIFVVGTCFLSAAAQQRAGNPWEVVGGYVCSQTTGNSAPEKLYLLPDMTWSRNPPFTSFASREHLSYSYSFRQPENLPDWMQVMVNILRKNHRYTMFVNSGWKPRVFRYDGNMLFLYVADNPPARTIFRQPLPDEWMTHLFGKFRLDPVSHELIEMHALIGRQSSMRCRRESLF
ncbi:MAG TPA: hypothetical protein VI685_25035 [Candidatus Angelobacter sp.]